MPESAEQCIVVGFDGSPASRAAVSHALRRVRGGGRLVVVHAVKAPAGRYGHPNEQRLLDAEIAAAGDRLDRLPDEIPGLSAVDWEFEIAEGAAGRAIARAAEIQGASEIVVGTRGAGRAAALLGSVAHDVLHRASCPVVVIPERAVTGPAGSGRDAAGAAS
jgi:nucleotide-binding universal stress UspA family protein